MPPALPASVVAALSAPADLPHEETPAPKKHRQKAKGKARSAAEDYPVGPAKDWLGQIPEQWRKPLRPPGRA